jgi:tetratricopeptide (TPR) repeat protein
VAWFYKGLTPDNMVQARSYFNRALVADPDNVDALIGLAGAEAIEGVNSFATDSAASFAAAEAKLTRALSSVPDHAVGHMWLGLVYIWTRRAAEGIARCEYALALDRNLARAEGAIGFGKINTGRAEETEAHIVEALRLSPRDTTAFVWMTHVGLAKNLLGSWEQAVAWCRRAIEANRNYPRAHFQLALALAQLGRLDEAHSSVKAGIAINPSFTVTRARVDWTALSDDPTYLAQLERIFDGLLKAGVPKE